MPINKNAYLRYKAIDLRLRSQYRSLPDMRDLIDACEKAIDYRPSIETIQKDIMVMRQDPPKGFAAPIKYCRRNYVYEYTDPDYTIDNIGLNDLDIDFKEEGSILNEHLNSIVFLFLSMIFI